jgi:hypothetical protein
VITVPVEQVIKLENLGFSRDDCEKSLSISQGQLDEAALWLTQNATPSPSKQKEDGGDGFSLSGFEVIDPFTHLSRKKLLAKVFVLSLCEVILAKISKDH